MVPSLGVAMVVMLLTQPALTAYGKRPGLLGAPLAASICASMRTVWPPMLWLMKCTGWLASHAG